MPEHEATPVVFEGFRACSFENWSTIYRISGRNGFWKRSSLEDWNKSLVSEKTFANVKLTYSTRRSRFVRFRELEQVFLDAVGRELVTERDLMFCDRCGDCSRSVVSFNDGVLCRPCAAGL